MLRCKAHNIQCWPYSVNEVLTLFLREKVLQQERTRAPRQVDDFTTPFLLLGSMKHEIMHALFEGLRARSETCLHTDKRIMANFTQCPTFSSPKPTVCPVPAIAPLGRSAAIAHCNKYSDKIAAVKRTAILAGLSNHSDSVVCWSQP